MFASESLNLGWLFPLAMMAVCFFLMKARRRSSMCGFGSGDTDQPHIDGSDSAKGILDKRFALGEINKEEYEEKKRILSGNAVLKAKKLEL
ncbi:MAG: hypothetical protein H8E17_01570 [Deltaproteobacteria bacterium]|nr:hypothetical protein [Deltaproteobacteria bacterium]